MADAFGGGGTAAPITAGSATSRQRNAPKAQATPTDFIGPSVAKGDAPSIVTFLVGGFSYTGWERVVVSYAATDAARSFAFTISDLNDSEHAWNFLPSDQVVAVLVDGEVVVTGYIDSMAPSYSGTNHTVEISGRSKGADMIDSSHVHPKSEFNQKSVADIASELAPDGVSITSDQPLEAMEYFRLQPGETVFSALDRAASRSGTFLQSTPDGGVKITRGSSRSIHPPLIEGQNILAASASFNNTNRTTTTRVHGQRSFAQAPKGSLRVQGTATDHSMRRDRHKVIIAEGDMTAEQAKKHADWHQNRQLGESVKASVRLVGLRDDNGRMWECNTLVYVFSPMLKLDMQLAIQSVELTQDKGGTFTSLNLVHPAALSNPAPEHTGGHKNATHRAWGNKHVQIANPTPKG